MVKTMESWIFHKILISNFSSDHIKYNFHYEIIKTNERHDKEDLSGSPVAQTVRHTSNHVTKKDAKSSSNVGLGGDDENQVEETEANHERRRNGEDGNDGDDDLHQGTDEGDDGEDGAAEWPGHGVQAPQLDTKRHGQPGSRHLDPRHIVSSLHVDRLDHTCIDNDAQN